MCLRNPDFQCIKTPDFELLIQATHYVRLWVHFMKTYNYFRFGLYVFLFIEAIVLALFGNSNMELTAILSTWITSILAMPMNHVYYMEFGGGQIINSEAIRVILTSINYCILLAAIAVIPWYYQQRFIDVSFYQSYTYYWMWLALSSTYCVIPQVEQVNVVTWGAFLFLLICSLNYFGVVLLLATGPADYQHYYPKLSSPMKVLILLAIVLLVFVVLRVALIILWYF